jgi:hypothetical protein
VHIAPVTVGQRLGQTAGLIDRLAQRIETAVLTAPADFAAIAR